jgi:broad specificity phosphatase PhoE
MSETVLYLVRHGAIGPAGAKSFVGQIDLPLSDEGVEQSKALRNWLEPVRFSHVFTSDLLRARRTCEIIADPRTHSIQSLPALREISLGQWEGITFDEIQRRFPDAYAARGRNLENWRPPGGESFGDCRARAMGALLQILDRAHGNVLLVAHAGVNRLILCDVLGILIANLHTIGQDYGCLNIIEYANSRTRLKLLNFVPPSARRIAEVNSSSAVLAAQS